MVLTCSGIADLPGWMHLCLFNSRLIQAAGDPLFFSARGNSVRGISVHAAGRQFRFPDPDSSASRGALRRADGFARRNRSRGREAGVGKWKTCFWFSTFPDRFAGAVGMWESRLPLARFPRGLWKERKARLWLSTLSTAPAFPRPRLCSQKTAAFSTHEFCYRAQMLFASLSQRRLRHMIRLSMTRRKRGSGEERHQKAWEP